jgi:preprotein translocase subunit SecA
MLRGILTKVVGDANQKELNRLQHVVDDVNALESAFEGLSDSELRAKTGEFRRRLAQGETLDDLLVEAFSAVREASKRTINMRHFDVQLVGGSVLHQGKIAEMKTGEGKTLVATLPLYLNALDFNPEWEERAQQHWGGDPRQWSFDPLDGIPVGRGVHLVTVNDYLARRDGGWMGGVFDALGLSVGLVIPFFSGLYDPAFVSGTDLFEDDRLVHWNPCSRRQAYQADITYGTNNEFGFDYLRDNMVRDLAECAQRELNYAIIDEIDNVLIDEARTPLIISGPAEEPSDNYRLFSRIAPRLRPSTSEEEPDGDYILDEKSRNVTLTDAGIEKVERALGIENLYSPENSDLTPYLDNAIRAHVIYHRDKDYVVQNGQVVIVDEFTGRLLHGRRYSEGLHQAIEAKENLAIQRESLTYATITIQNYFRMYRKLAGMTGTAATEGEEFHKIYSLDVTVLPTNIEYRSKYGDPGKDGLIERQKDAAELDKVTFAGVLDQNGHAAVTTYVNEGSDQCYYRRLDLQDAIYADQATKFEAIVNEIETLHDLGRPVLVGTIAVEISERLSLMLKKRGIPHHVLNAKQHEQEARVIAQAGRPGGVTVATNMAGRGVDILLGGDLEALTTLALKDIFESRLRQANLLQVGQVGGVHREAQDTANKLLAEYQAYQSAQKSKKASSLPVFFAEKLINEGHVNARDRGRAVRLARHVINGEWQEAGEIAQRADGMSMETIAQIQRMREELAQAADAKDYAISGVSAELHNVLVTTIRRTLHGQEEEAHELLKEYGLPPDILQVIKQEQEKIQRDQERVRTLGGLHVIGTERHDARRIDNQLRGRAGRQGDPGSSRFFLSMDDELMRRFGGERVQSLMRRTWQEDAPMEFGILSKAVESAQTRVEGYNFDIRKHVIEYDDVINKQREVIYEQRRQVLSADDLRDQMVRMLQDTIAELVAAHCIGHDSEDWDLEGLYRELRAFLPVWDHGFLPRPEDFSTEQWASLSREQIQEELYVFAEMAYDLFYLALGRPAYQDALKQELTLAQIHEANDALHRLIYQRVVKHLDGEPDDAMAQRPLRRLPDDINEKIEAGFIAAMRVHRDRQLMLQTVDGLWIRHLTDLDVLRQGIGLRAFGQRDPLVSFKKEAHEMYQALLSAIQTTVVNNLFRLPAAPRSAPRSERERRTKGTRGRKRRRR